MSRAAAWGVFGVVRNAVLFVSPGTAYINAAVDWNENCCTDDCWWCADWFWSAFSDGNEVGWSVCRNAARDAAENSKAGADKDAGSLKIFESAEKNAENAAFDNLIRYAFIAFLVAIRLAKNSWRRFTNDADFHAFESMLGNIKNSHLIWFDVNFSLSWWHRKISFSIQSVQFCKVLYSVFVIEIFFFSIHTPCFRSTVRNSPIVTVETRLKFSSVKSSKSSRNSFHNSMFLQSNIFHSSISVAMNSEMTIAIFFIIEMTQTGRQRSVSRTMLQGERQGEKLTSIMTVDSVGVVSGPCRVLPTNWSWSVP